jgi:hypothetical protein
VTVQYPKPRSTWLDDYIGTSAYLIITLPALALVTTTGHYELAGWLLLFYLPTFFCIAVTERRDSWRRHGR